MRNRGRRSRPHYEKSKLSVVEDNGGEGFRKGAGLTRSERRLWKLHCQLAHHLTDSTLAQWQPTIERNLRQLRAGVTGQPHTRNLDRWESLVKHGDVAGLYRVLTRLDRESIEMREVSPLGGLLADDERTQALRNATPPKRRFGDLARFHNSWFLTSSMTRFLPQKPMCGNAIRPHSPT